MDLIFRMKRTFRLLQEGLGDAESAGAGLEIHGDLRGEGRAGGLEGLDLLAPRGVPVEEGAGRGVEGGGFSGFVGGGEDVQSRGERADPDRFTEAPHAGKFERMENH